MSESRKPKPKRVREYTEAAAIRFAADAFVGSLGTVNRDSLSKNLRYTVVDSDALRELKAALRDE